MTVYTSLEQLLALKIPEVQRIFLNVMQDIVDRALLDEMIAAIEANDAERLFRATGFTQAALAPIIDAIEQVYRDSAETTVAGWPKRIRTPTGLTIFRFDMRNPRAEQDLRTVSSRLVAQLTEEARQNVRNALQQGMIDGRNPRSTALDIIGRIDPATRNRVGGLIGLTQNQEGWVRNADRYLRQLDPKYLNLKLRDKRFDSIVKKAIESGKPLSETDVSRLVTAFKGRALKYRGEAVARTETIQTLNRGEYMATRQAIDEGLIKDSAVTKEWDDTGDGKVRPTHRVMASKYGKGKGVALDEPFESPSGARLMYPGDPGLGASAAEIVHCRCRMHVRVDWLAGVD
jgi:hypothetical protein